MPTVMMNIFAIVGFTMTLILVPILGYELIHKIHRSIKQYKELNERFRAECVCRDCYNFDETQGLQGECRLLILNRQEKIKRGLIYNPNVFFCRFGEKKSKYI